MWNIFRYLVARLRPPRGIVVFYGIDNCDAERLARDGVIGRIKAARYEPFLCSCTSDDAVKVHHFGTRIGEADAEALLGLVRDGMRARGESVAACVKPEQAR